MTSRDFCYWLRGYLELAGESSLNEVQVKLISEHLKFVMEEKAKPSKWPPFSKEEIQREADLLLKEQFTTDHVFDINCSHCRVNSRIEITTVSC